MPAYRESCISRIGAGDIRRAVARVGSSKVEVPSARPSTSPAMAGRAARPADCRCCHAATQKAVAEELTSLGWLVQRRAQLQPLRRPRARGPACLHPGTRVCGRSRGEERARRPPGDARPRSTSRRGSPRTIAATRLGGAARREPSAMLVIGDSRTARRVDRERMPRSLRVTRFAGVLQSRGCGDRDRRPVRRPVVHETARFTPRDRYRRGRRIRTDASGPDARRRS